MWHRSYSSARGRWRLSEHDQRGSDEARGKLRSSLRRQLEQMQPPLRTLAENVLAEGSRIDLVARDPLGGLVVILIGEAGQDLALLTRALAHRCWVEQRIPDWLQLAPELELSSEVHALALCPEFRPETIAAARAIQPLVRLSRFRSLADCADPLLLEPVDLEPLEKPAIAPALTPAATPPAPQPAPAPRDPPSHPGEFRSGLSESDLQITPDERREFG